jgi:YVTN family beta-propeller protein
MAILPALPDGVVGVPFNSPITVGGGIGALSWSVTLGALPPGLALDPATGLITGTPLAAGAFPFSVTVHDSGFPPNSVARAFTLTVAPPSGPTDLSVSLAPDQNPVAAGATLTYTLTVTNAGAINQATGVTATFTVPSSVTFLSALGTGVCTRAGSLVTCDIGALAPLAVASEAIQVRPDVGGVTIVANADVESALDPNPNNDSVTTSTQVTGAGVHQVWVSNAGDSNPAITIVNADTNTSAATITLAAPADDVAFSPDGLVAYVVNSTTNNVAVVDPKTSLVVTNVPIAEPVKAAVSPDGSILYVTGASPNVSVFNTQPIAFVTTIAVGQDPAGVTFSPDGKRAYVANRNSNTVSVIDTSLNSVVATVPVGTFPVDVVASPNGKRAYVANFFDSSVSVLDTKANVIIDTIFVGDGPQGLAISPDGTRIYVANFNDDTVSVVDTTSDAVIATPIVIGSPNGIVASPDGNFVYVTAYNADAVRVIDTTTNTVVTSVGTASLPISAVNLRRQP